MSFLSLAYPWTTLNNSFPYLTCPPAQFSHSLNNAYENAASSDNGLPHLISRECQLPLSDAQIAH